MGRELYIASQIRKRTMQIYQKFMSIPFKKAAHI